MSHRFPFFRPCIVAAALVLFGVVSARAVSPLSIERVSLGFRGGQSNNDSYGPVSVSGDGRWVAFTSAANLAREFNSVPDVFVRDRRTGFTQVVSRADSTFAGNNFANGASGSPAISEEGRHIAFTSLASNLVASAAGALLDTNGVADVFVRDRRGGTLRVSTSTAGVQGDGPSGTPSISGDGSVVAFTSAATNLAPGDTNTVSDVFVALLETGGLMSLDEVRLISRNGLGVVGNGPSGNPSVSADGRYVAFESTASNLVGGDSNGASDIFLYDVQLGTLKLISRASNAEDGSEGEQGVLGSHFPAVSADGRYVAFVSEANNLVEDDNNGVRDVFVRDTQTGVTERVSLGPGGAEGDGPSTPDFVASPASPDPLVSRPAISLDGRYVAFASSASNFAPSDNNLVPDVFVRDRVEQTTVAVSTTLGGILGDGASTGPGLAGDGSLVAFESQATNLVAGDTNARNDVFAVGLSAVGAGNQPPVVSAGEDQEVAELEEVTLDGGDTFDPDDDELTYSWRQVAGLPVTLEDADTPFAAFIAPLVGLAGAQLVFELTVSDGVNAPVSATTTVLVVPAEFGVVEGEVVDGNGNPLAGALVTVVRQDGEEATATETDEDGFYVVDDVRAGHNTITVEVEGFEPVSREFIMQPGGLRTENFRVNSPLAEVQGRVQLSNGAGLGGALVELIGPDGDVLDEDETDAAGNYRIGGITRAAILLGISVRISHSSVPDWVAALEGLQAGRVNVRNFRYGSLQVTVRTQPASLANRLNGTRVEILVGGEVIATRNASRRVRQVRFPNVPATLVRVRATNPRLSSSERSLTIRSGVLSRITVTLRRGAF